MSLSTFFMVGHEFMIDDLNLVVRAILTEDRFLRREFHFDILGKIFTLSNEQNTNK
jgi:hypothetical protein